MQGATLLPFKRMLHQCTASLSKQEVFGVVKLSSPALVLGMKQPIIVPHHNDR